MLKMAMAGLEYDKEAFLGSAIGGIGKVLAKGFLGGGARRTGLNLMRKGGALNRARNIRQTETRNLQSGIRKAGGRLGIRGKINSTMSNMSGPFKNIGRRGLEKQIAKTRLNNIRNIQYRRADNILNNRKRISNNVTKGYVPKYDLAPQQFGKGTPFKSDGRPRKSIRKQMDNGGFKWSAEKGPATSGSAGDPITMKPIAEENKIHPNETTPPNTKTNPSETTTPNATTTDQQAEIDKLKKKNRKLKEKQGDLLGQSRKFIKKNPLTAVAGTGVIGHMMNNNNGGSPVVVNR